MTPQSRHFLYLLLMGVMTLIVLLLIGFIWGLCTNRIYP